MAYTCSNAAGVCSVSFNYIVLLSERVFCRIADACRLVISNLIHIYADIFKYLIQRLSIMSEGDRSMMRIISLNQYISGMAKMPIAPKERVATGRTSPFAT